LSTIPPGSAGTFTWPVGSRGRPAWVRSFAAISAISSGCGSGTNAFGCGGRSFGSAPSGGLRVRDGRIERAEVYYGV
jgi:hypothetical protein